jgi:hypothetical protein
MVAGALNSCECGDRAIRAEEGRCLKCGKTTPAPATIGISDRQLEHVLADMARGGRPSGDRKRSERRKP